ncbi:MAG: LysM peptidoglycan-binding domain-containing protein [Phycisphaerales bacterium]|jgi:nucleoid-associated protein YgaU|nr:LysM peptidoglycan-binding domain-containing protein [Phycisphaerales bacterium]
MDSNNKISIVIGFGLLIFVGMFTADHFSTATNREVAMLGGELQGPPPIPASQLISGPLPPLETEPPSNAATIQTHVVRAGDSLRSICSHVYGDAGLANALARWNGIPSANQIEIGEKIVLPTRIALVSAPLETDPQEADPSQVPTTTQTVGTYVVKSGDTLSQIAQEVCGSTKFTQKLIVMNKKTMPNPDRLQVGMKLVYPLN